MALFIGGCAILLIWVLSGGLPKKGVVTWDGLSYAADELGVRGVRYLSVVNDSEYMFVITPDDLPEAEDYTITKPAALTASEAAALARSALDLYLSIDDQSDWHLVQVTLNHCVGTKWYYTVSFKPETDLVRDDGTANELRIPVLMDSTVVKGVLRPSIRNREKILRVAAEAQGVTPEELLMRRREEAAQMQEAHDVTLISHVDNKVFKFEIPRDELLQQDDMLSPSPLLSFHEVADLAQQCSRLYLPAGQGMGWQIKELSLNRWGNSHKWYFLADFRLQGTEQGVVAPQLLIPILLDGKAIQGQPIQTGIGF